jgi:hypothetical protein
VLSNPEFPVYKLELAEGATSKLSSSNFGVLSIYQREEWGGRPKILVFTGFFAVFLDGNESTGSAEINKL